MNIVFLADIVPFPPNTGIKIRTFNILRQLHETGNTVYLIAFNHPVFLAGDEQKQAARRALEAYCAEVHILDIPTERHPVLHDLLLLLNLFDYQPYRVRRYMSAEARAICRRLVRHNGIDLVHLDKTEFYAYAGCFPGIPMVATNHNVESDLMRQRSRFERSIPRKVFAYWQFLKTRRYEKYALTRVNGYLACTEVDLDHFENRLGIRNRHAVIENGVDCRHYHPVATAEEDQVLIIGAQNRDSTANFDATVYFLQEIWPLVRRQNPALQLKIAGRHPDPAIYEMAGQGEGIEVLGYVENDREILSRSKALLVPLRVGGGSRLKILTAMGMGKTVISTSKGAEGIECRNGENILIADQPEEFARLVCRVAGDAELRRRTGGAARRLAENVYDWSVIGRKMAAFYAEIVASRHRVESAAPGPKGHPADAPSDQR